MKGISLCIRSKGFSARSLLGLSLALSLLLSSLISPLASAVSDYDDTVNTVEDLKLTNADGDEIDISTEYLAILESCNPTAYSAFNSATADPNGHWGITVGHGNIGYGGPQTFATLYWSTSTSTNSTFEDLGSYTWLTVDPVKTVDFRYRNDNSWTCAYDSGNSGIGLSTSVEDKNTSGWLRIFYTNWEIDYPAGYAGEYPPDSYNPATKLYPDIIYSVDKFELNALPDANQALPMGFTASSYRIHYTLYDKDSTDVLKDQADNTNSIFKYTFDDYGTYGLDVKFEPKGIPAPGVPDGYEFINVKLKIKIDGNSYVSNINNDSCDEDGNCDEAFTLEDCDGYGTDIAGAFGCHIRNFGRTLKTTLIGLFLPPPVFFTGFWAEMRDFMNDKLGFVYQSIAAIVGLLGGMIVASATPDCNLSTDGTFFGANYDMNLCTFADVFPAPWVAFQAIVIGLTVIALLFAFNAKYREVVDAR